MPAGLQRTGFVQLVKMSFNVTAYWWLMEVRRSLELNTFCSLKRCLETGEVTIDMAAKLVYSESELRYFYGHIIQSCVLKGYVTDSCSDAWVHTWQRLLLINRPRD
jgi:hypothetical protein